MTTDELDELFDNARAVEKELNKVISVLIKYRCAITNALTEGHSDKLTAAMQSVQKYLEELK